jgi:transposase-like protein
LNTHTSLANYEEESRIIYTDGSRAYDPLDDEYAGGEVHANTCKSYRSLL